MSTRFWKAGLTVTFLSRSQSAIHVTETVHSDGFFLRSDAPPAPMTLVRFEVLLPPDDERLVMHGMITSTVHARSPRTAAGVEVAFFARSAEAGASWARFMRYLEEKHPRACERSVLFARESPQTLRRHTFIDDFSAVDATPGGIFLATQQRIAVGTDVRVKIVSCATGQERTVDGVVRRRVQGAGIGVEYRNMTSETWTSLVAFLGQSDEQRVLRAEVHAVWTPPVPMVMQTLAGPWSNDVIATSSSHRPEWSLPPESGWCSPSELPDSAGE